MIVFFTREPGRSPGSTITGVTDTREKAQFGVEEGTEVREVYVPDDVFAQGWTAVAKYCNARY